MCGSDDGGYVEDKTSAEDSDFSVYKRVPQKLKGKFYRTAIHSAMLYGAECWSKKDDMSSN